MEATMKAITFSAKDGIELKHIPQPEQASPGHILIKMEACGINPGDKAFINGTFTGATVPVSKYNVGGVSGAGTVVAIGEGVPQEYVGQQVTVYRSLRSTDEMIGTWCQYAHLPYLQCAILPAGTDLREYAGSLVNIITPYAFLKQAIADGHKGIIATAGTSATGIAMLGICQAYHFPIISIVRTAADKKELEALGATHIVAQDDTDFKTQLKDMAQQLSATAVFDGVGGEVLNKIIDVVPIGSTIYAYGFLGGPTPLIIHTSALMRGIALRGFGNFKSPTVQDSSKLAQALKDISAIIHMPHFKTKAGKQFKLEEVNEALKYTGENGEKAVLYPFL